MAYHDESDEARNILAAAEGEAKTYAHQQIGCDHIFLAMLQDDDASTQVVLRYYKGVIDQVRKIVRRNTDSWILKKILRDGEWKDRVMTMTPEYVRACNAAVELAHELGGSDAKYDANHLLESMLLEVQQADRDGRPTNLLMLLNELQVDYRALLASVQMANRPKVAS